jgi:hypothetical protein
MQNAAVPPWDPVDSRRELLSEMEIEEGTNSTSLCDDQIECPYPSDVVWHTITCEANGAARRTAAAAARALANALDEGRSPDEAHAEVRKARSACEDLNFVRWAYCHFANIGDAFFKLPATIVAQANDIPFETTVLGQYRIGTVLPISASDAVRLFNTPCYVGTSLCIEPLAPSKASTTDGRFAISTSVFNPNNAVDSSSCYVFLEDGPDPNELRKLKLAQAELSKLERELMEVVSHRAFKERGCSGDMELSWGEVDAYVCETRVKEEALRARLLAVSSHTKNVDARRKKHASEHLHNELEKEHSSLAVVVLLNSKVCDLRENVYELSESIIANKRVIAWSRWSQSTAAHTPPELPLIGKAFCCDFSIERGVTFFCRHAVQRRGIRVMLAIASLAI